MPPRQRAEVRCECPLQCPCGSKQTGRNPPNPAICCSAHERPLWRSGAARLNGSNRAHSGRAAFGANSKKADVGQWHRILRLDSGSINWPRSSEVQPQSGAKIVVKYTIFHEVKFAGGRVETGWVYQSSNDTEPQRQFRRYITNTDAATGSEESWMIGLNGQPATLPKLPEFDVTDALRNCVW
jgi:hypothetical protein